MTLATFGAKARFGRLAFVPKTNVKALAGAQNYVQPLKWFGVATGVKITSSRTELTQFEPSQLLLTVTGIDGSGQRIPETNLVYSQGGGFSTVTIAAGAYNQSLAVTTFVPTPWAFNGRYGGTETFTASGRVNKKTVAASSVSVKIGPGNASGTGQIIAASIPSQYGSPMSIVEFTSSAVGNVAPLRVINGTGRPYGASSNGDFWMATEANAQQFDTLGDVLGTVATPRFRKQTGASTVDSAQNEYGAFLQTNGSECGSPKIYVFAAGSFGTTISR